MAPHASSTASNRCRRSANCRVRPDARAHRQLDSQPRDRGHFRLRAHRGAARLSVVSLSSRPPGSGFSSKIVQAWPNWRKIVGGRRPVGPAPMIATRLPVGRLARGQVRIGRGEVHVGHQPLQQADRHGPVEVAAAADLFARRRADAAQHGRQGDVAFDRGDRLAELPGGDLPQHRGNVHLGRAGELARGQAIAQVVAQAAIPAPFAGPGARPRSRSRPPCPRPPPWRRRARAGRSSPIRTRHTRHEVDGLHPSRKHRAGMSMPSFRAASSTVAPGGHFHFAMVDGQLGHGKVRSDRRIAPSDVTAYTAPT